MIQPSLPERFPYAALTFVTDSQLFFVAISPSDGKTLEIQLASNAYSAGPTTTVDATGQWAESAQGWLVKTQSGLFVSVTCNIGVGGRDFIGPTNYCDMTSGVPAFSKNDVRAVADSLATSLTPAIFDAALRVGDVGSSGTTNHPTGTLPALDANQPPATTSVRVVHGIYPNPTVTSLPAATGYNDAAAIWALGSGGVAIRLSTLDPSPESVTRLEQLATGILNLDPAVSVPATPTADSVLQTATTADSLAAVGGGDSTTSTSTAETNTTVLGAQPDHVPSESGGGQCRSRGRHHSLVDQLTGCRRSQRRV